MKANKSILDVSDTVSSLSVRRDRTCVFSAEVCVVLCCVVAHAPALLSPVANRTVNQANVAGETAVAGANEMSQATVEGVENVAAATGMMNPVGGASRPADLMQQIIILGCSFIRELLGLEPQAVTFDTIYKNQQAFRPGAFTLNTCSTQPIFCTSHHSSGAAPLTKHTTALKRISPL